MLKILIQVQTILVALLPSLQEGANIPMAALSIPDIMVSGGPVPPITRIIHGIISSTMIQRVLLLPIFLNSMGFQ
jgi:hypothetical protein